MIDKKLKVMDVVINIIVIRFQFCLLARIDFALNIQSVQIL